MLCLLRFLFLFLKSLFFLSAMYKFLDLVFATIFPAPKYFLFVDLITSTQQPPFFFSACSVLFPHSRTLFFLVVPINLFSMHVNQKKLIGYMQVKIKGTDVKRFLDITYWSMLHKPPLLLQSNYLTKFYSFSMTFVCLIYPKNYKLFTMWAPVYDLQQWVAYIQILSLYPTFVEPAFLRRRFNHFGHRSLVIAPDISFAFSGSLRIAFPIKLKWLSWRPWEILYSLFFSDPSLN